MYYTGFADEAAEDIDGQIRAIKELGWSNIELRSVNGTNITDISDELFNEVADKLDETGITVNAFGSTIANWGKSVLEPMDDSLSEVSRAIPRMQRLGVKYVRVMSFGVLRDREPDDQLFDERVARLQQIVKLFEDAGLQALHENCANYGGMGWQFTQKLIDAIPELKLIFDTANPATTLDRSKPKPYPCQSSWEFYEKMKEHIVHVHIKDGKFLADNPDSVFEEADYVLPGEGDGDVRRIVADLISNGYEGGLSIEPHLAVVFHNTAVESSTEARFESFVDYGQHLEKLVNTL